MAIEILMPALSPTMTEGNLVKWLKKEGDKLEAGQVIAEIETDKATMEVEAVDEGVLAKVIVPAKTENVQVNQLIAVLKEDGDKDTDVQAIIDSHGAPKENKEAPTAQPEEIVKTEIPAPAATLAPQPMVSTGSGQRIFASPLAKRIAEQKGIALHNVQGSGPHGRIIKADVENFSGAGMASHSVGRNSCEYTLQPVDNMRKVIAKRLVESKQTVPHFYVSMDCRLGCLLKVREKMNNKADKVEGKAEYKISVNDFIIKAVAQALKKHPEINASWSEEGILSYNNVDVSVAVSIDGGLITPIIQNADQKNLLQLSHEMKDLAKRARESALAPEEFQGGGFTISNLGMYGVTQFNAIVNPPQSCILAVGAAVEKPVINNGEITKATVMTLSLSCDHRVVDGALGAEFLGTVRDMIETPALMLL